MFKLKLFLLFITITRSFSQVPFSEYKNILDNKLLMKISDYVDDAEKICLMQLSQLQQSMNETWAQRMLDASGKLPSGILEGNLYELGQFDECIQVDSMPENSVLPIKGKYCVATLPIPTNFSLPFYNGFQKLRSINDAQFNPAALRANNENKDGFPFELNIGICFPSSCTSATIESALKQLLENKLNLKNVSLSIMPDNLCTTAEPTPWTAGDWGAVAVLIFFAVLLILSTLYDVITYILVNKGQSIQKNIYFASFSVWTNTLRLLKSSPNPGPLSSLHGIRVLSMFWVICGHRHMAVLLLPPTNSLELFQWARTYWSMFVFGGTVSVDTFFLLSGMLLSYTFFKKTKNSKSFNIFMFYFHRILRLTPALALVILLQATIFKHLASGPIWKKSSAATVEPCQNNWWVTLLYVQNYVRSTEVCVGQSWYLAADMHYYILSPIILYPILKNRKIGMIMAFFWTLVSLVIVTVICFVYEWPAGMMPPNNNMAEAQDRQQNYYFVSHTRATPWLIGFLAGYFFHTSVNTTIRLNKVLVMLAWVASFVLMWIVVFGMSPLQKTDHVISYLEDSTYLSFSRTAWTIAVLWVIFACAHGYGGPVNWFLSWELWEIIGRLTYSMYLVHILIQVINVGSRRNADNFTPMKTIHLFLGDLVATILVAYCLAIIIEFPITVLEKALFNIGGDKKSKSETKKNIHDDKNPVSQMVSQ